MKHICLALVCLLLLNGCSKAVSKALIVTIGSATIQVEIADNNATRYQGLSDRASLAKDQGMLFILDESNFHGFVMRRMNFPLDIIWLNDNKIVDIKTDLPPDNSADPVIYYPIAPSNTVLEVPAGTANAYDWKIGDKAFISTAK